MCVNTLNSKCVSERHLRILLRVSNFFWRADTFHSAGGLWPCPYVQVRNRRLQGSRDGEAAQICPSGGVRSTLETEPCSLVLWKQTHFSLCFPRQDFQATRHPCRPLTVAVPQSHTTTVNIDVSDVNDNAPSSPGGTTA